MVAHELVPALEIVHSASGKRLLPDAADGEPKVWAGNDGFRAYGYTVGGSYSAHLPGTVSFRFLADRSSVVAFTDSGVPRPTFEDSYRRNVFPLVLQLRGHGVLNPSAVTPDSKATPAPGSARSAVLDEIDQGVLAP